MQDGTLPISMSHTYELTGHDHCLGNTVGIVSFTECFFFVLWNVPYEVIPLIRGV